MKIIPILFSTPMVQGILDDRKTMTRRIMKPQPYPVKRPPNYDDSTLEWDASKKITDLPESEWTKCCPYGQPGGVLWVRETTTILEPEHCMGGMDSRFVYKTNMDTSSEEIRQEYIRIGYPYQWKPSIFMKKEACRIFLQITDIKVERLQDISEHDAEAEGVNVADCCHAYYHGFSLLWQKINGAESWEANPFVWCISFKRINKPNNF